MPLSSVKIAVVDSNRLFRAGLVSLLADATKQDICEVADVRELEHKVAEGQTYDLVLLDLRSGDCSPARRIKQVRSFLPSCRIAMLTDGFDPAQMRACFAAGADGFLLKDIGGETLLGSLNLILLGEKIFPSPLADLLSAGGDGTYAGLTQPVVLFDGGATSGLSEREIEILRCLVTGDSNKRIANRLNIAEATVKVHLKSILRKTRAMNRTQAAIWALQRGMSGLAAGLVILAAASLQFGWALHGAQAVAML